MIVLADIIPFTINNVSWLFCGFVIIAVFFEKFIHTTGRVDQFLFAGEEWMALRTNFNGDVANSGVSLKLVAAGASHSCHIIVRMNSFFHFILLAEISI